ncbi:MAG TPA: PEP-CTERM sorting domain-containing protein [Planctomycetota bacterium]|nr:PEP-CTERM sorting domain-containing protein [Planctomycetota bacterium]
MSSRVFGAPIPEPGTMLLLRTGVLGALGYVRRRRMR